LFLGRQVYRTERRAGGAVECSGGTACRRRRPATQAAHRLRVDCWQSSANFSQDGKPVSARSRCGRWLFFHSRQRGINASPTRRTGRPYGHCGIGKIRIVESPNPNEDQMRSCLGLAKKRSAANRAKSAVHSTATVGHAGEVARFPYDFERRRAKTSADRSAACAQILTIATPANPRGDRRFHALPANRTAKAPACHCHQTLQVR